DALRVDDADLSEQLERALARLGSRQPELLPHRDDELAADRERRVEVRDGLLWDVGDLRAAEPLVRPLAGIRQLDPVEPDRAGRDAAALGQQTERRERCLGLARARLAHQP